jgi:hypothetical protein
MARASWVSWLAAHHNAIWFAGKCSASLCGCPTSRSKTSVQASPADERWRDRIRTQFRSGPERAIVVRPADSHLH